MTTCTMANISETTTCLQDSLGCTLKMEGPGDCAMLSCRGGEIFVCQNTIPHDELDEASDANWCEEPCGCC